MGRIPDTRFAALGSYWSTHQPSLFPEPPSAVNGYLRMRCTTGAGGGSFHFDDNDGNELYVLTRGDFDVIADMQCLNAAETDLPPTNAAHMFVLCCHSPVQPEDPQYSAVGWGQRIYYHRGPGHATGGASSARVMDEWKFTTGSPGDSTFQTLDGHELRDAAALGASFSELGGRWWVRMRRQGQVFDSWSLPYQTETPTASSAWVNNHQVTIAEMPDLTRLGFATYSSSASGDVTGRCRAFLNTEP